jgi:anti-sigma regulatory factor (Ser/Thr protein kinase)
VCCDPVLEAEPTLIGPGHEVDHIHLDPNPRAARDARRFVALHTPTVDSATASTLAVLTSELVTNAVLHARTALQVGVAREGQDLLIGVGDRGNGHPAQQPASETATQGRGLRLIDGLADRWGITRYEGGKTVWFLLKGVRAPDAGARPDGSARYGVLDAGAGSPYGGEGAPA